MTKSKRAKSIVFFIANLLFTIIFLFALLITANALVGMIRGYQPSIFGHTVSKIMSGSMESAGFKKDDYVVTKKVKSASDLKVGDIITWYATPDLKPVLEGDDRKEVIVIFHQIIRIDETTGYFITKGTDVATEDAPVPFESISGKYSETGAGVAFLVKALLADNRFLYWVVGILALLAIKQIFALFGATKDYKLQRQVLAGKRRLLDKECFERNIFNDFSYSGKQKLIKNAPYGMAMLYEYLLFGRVTKLSDQATAEQIKGKRCGMNDVLCLTYSGEIGDPLDKNEYIKQLPKRHREYAKYRNVSEFKKASKAERTGALVMLLAMILFTAAYALITFLTGYYRIVHFIEPLVIGLVLLGCIFYFLVVIFENSKTARKLERYLRSSTVLPERYHFFVESGAFTSEEVEKNGLDIEYRLSARALSATDNAITDMVTAEDVAAAQAAQSALMLQQSAVESEETVQDAAEESLDAVEGEGETATVAGINPFTYAFDPTPEPYYLAVPQAEQGEVVANRFIDADLVDTGEDSDAVKKRRNYIALDTRLRMTTEETKQRYSTIINEIFKYHKVKSKFSARYDTISKGSKPLMRIALNNTTLKVYFALDPAAYPEKYRINDMSGQKAFEQYPALLRVRADASFARALELIGDLVQVHDLKPVTDFRPHDYAREYAYVNPFTIKSTGRDCEQFLMAEYPVAMAEGHIKSKVSVSDDTVVGRSVWLHPVFGEITGYLPLLGRLGLSGDSDFMVTEDTCAFATSEGMGKQVRVEIGVDTLAREDFEEIMSGIVERYGMHLEDIQLKLNRQQVAQMSDVDDLIAAKKARGLNIV